MKKLVFCIIILTFFATVAMAQAKVQRIPLEIPQFRVSLTNGSYYNTKDVPANKPFVLIYFAPDCDHCTTLLDKLFTRINELDKTSVLLVTFKKTTELVPFEKKYQTFKHPNIKVGTEGLSYKLRNFYKLEKTPFVAVYNKNGKLVTAYKNETPADELLGVIKKL